MKRRRFPGLVLAPALVLSLSLAGCVPAAGTGSGASPVTPPGSTSGGGAEYRVYVAAESADLLHRIRFGPGGAEVERTIPVGRLPTENEGPHGIAISRDGRHLYLTTGHGVPDGKLWKYATGADTLVGGETGLGFFPATVDVSPDGQFAFVVNFNLHGEHVPSTVSVVYTPEMMEVAATETCAMPHGSRLNPAGTRHYSACMMDDRVVEIDARGFGVARTLQVPASDGKRCSPTWVEPSVDGSHLYVACNRSDRIHEVDLGSWSIARTFTAGRAPYNLEATPDGRLLVATLKGQGAVQFFDLESGASLAITPSTTTVTHGVVASPDSRYAFVSVEGVGAEPGKVDIYDLGTFRLVDSVEVGQQAGGIGFWRMGALP